MFANHKHLLSFRNIYILLLPAIMYIVFFSIRILKIQPTPEAGMGDFITAVNFIFGASITYLMFVVRWLKLLPSNGSEEKWWWLLVSLFLLFLAYDEIYMVHENLGSIFHLRDVYIFLTYGAILLFLVYLHRHKMTSIFGIFLGGFILLAGVSVVSDTFLGEGFIYIFGREIDYEQLAESLGALSLSCAFVSSAVNETLQYITVSRKEADLTPVPVKSEADPKMPIN
ncbi:MAG: hypothetical protein CVT49_15910 [candidate division Zixibacteria bacterium HGW-Zixibacteria-1]|nr:MAG: hypothetical protein CVT49_15910 [candidate division Zixibacteria bacterium HGW-Zixibacteria-1]